MPDTSHPIDSAHEQEVNEAGKIIKDAIHEREVHEAANIVKEAIHARNIPDRSSSLPGAAAHSPSSGAKGPAGTSNSTDQVVGYLSIHAHGAKLTEFAGGKDIGHAWIAFRTRQDDPETVVRTAGSYGTCPFKRSTKDIPGQKTQRTGGSGPFQNPETALESWGNTGKRRPGVYTNLETRLTKSNLRGEGYGVFHEVPINQAQLNTLVTYIEKQQDKRVGWTLTTPCSAFAKSAFEAATGVSLKHRIETGFSTPACVVNSIREANERAELHPSGLTIDAANKVLWRSHKDRLQGIADAAAAAKKKGTGKSLER
jgi:hypothetical protein